MEHQETLRRPAHRLLMLAAARAAGAFRAQKKGVTAVEYGIVAAFLCLALLGIFKAFGSVVSTMFSGVSTGI